LIAAEELADRATSEPSAVMALDADADGQDELRVKTSAMSLVIDPAEGGTVTEWDLYAPRLNLLDTLSRRPEPYHAKLKARPVRAVPAGGVPPSIHDVVGIKEPHLESRLLYDDHRRSAFLDYALQQMPSLQEVVQSAWGERRLWSSGAFRPEPQPRRSPGRAGAALTVTMVRELAGGRILKTVDVGQDRPSLECRYTLEGLEVPVVGLEFNVSLRDARYLTDAGQHEQLSAFDLAEPAIGVRLRLAIEPPATLLHFPIETVSESEEGLERTYQGLCLVCLWAPGRPGLNEAGGGEGARSWTGRVRWSVERHPPAGPDGFEGRSAQPSEWSGRR